MADYGPLTPSNRLEWFLMNGGSGGSGGGGGGEPELVTITVSNTTAGNYLLAIPFYENGVLKASTPVYEESFTISAVKGAEYIDLANTGLEFVDFKIDESSTAVTYDEVKACWVITGAGTLVIGEYEG